MKFLRSLFVAASLSGFSGWAIAGLTLSALGVIAGLALGAAGVVLASPGILTAAVFIGGAGLLCTATSFCDVDSVTNKPVPSAAASAPVSSPIGGIDPTKPMSPSTWCSVYHPGWDYGVGIDGNTGLTVAFCQEPAGGGGAGYQMSLDPFCMGFTAPEPDGTCSPANSFTGLPSDGIQISNPSVPSAPKLELPSVASLPAGAYEIWPGSGLYGAPGGSNVIYDMRDANGNISGSAKTTLTENADGSKALEIEVIGSTDGGVLRVDVLPDGGRIITSTRDVSITDANGSPDKIKTASVTEYDAAGNKGQSLTFTKDVAEGGGTPPFTVAPVDGGDGNPFTTTPFTPDPGTGGTGSCTSGDCSTESTQLANKSLLQTISGLLQSIKNFFTGTATTPSDPTAKTGTEINAASLDGTGAFNGLKGWQLPAHSSQCPTSSFDWNGNTYTFDAHCQLATDHFAMFRGVMTLVFSISALFVVLKA